jgi:hypothetical protein
MTIAGGGPASKMPTFGRLRAWFIDRAILRQPNEHTASGDLRAQQRGHVTVRCSPLMKSRTRGSGRGRNSSGVPLRDDLAAVDSSAIRSEIEERSSSCVAR